MNHQLELTLKTRRPASRSRDRGGSLAAEEYLNLSGKRQDQLRRILLGFYAHPGTTTKQLAELTGMDRHMVARRAPDLMPSTRKDGLTGPLLVDLLEREDKPDGWRWRLSPAGLAMVHLVNGYNYAGRP